MRCELTILNWSTVLTSDNFFFYIINFFLWGFHFFSLKRRTHAVWMRSDRWEAGGDGKAGVAPRAPSNVVLSCLVWSSVTVWSEKQAFWRVRWCGVLGETCGYRGHRYRLRLVVCSYNQHCRGVRGRAMESMRVMIWPGIGISLCSSHGITITTLSIKNICVYLALDEHVIVISLEFG